MGQSQSSSNNNDKNKRESSDTGGKLAIGALGLVAGALAGYALSKSEEKQTPETPQFSTVGSKFIYNLSFRSDISGQVVHNIPDDQYEFLANLKINSAYLLHRQINLGSATSKHPAILIQCSLIDSPDPVYILLDLNMDTGYYIRIYFKQEQIYQEYEYTSQKTVRVKPEVQQFRPILDFIISLSLSNQSYDLQQNNDKVFIIKLKQFINIPTDII